MPPSVVATNGILLAPSAVAIGGLCSGGERAIHLVSALRSLASMPILAQARCRTAAATAAAAAAAAAASTSGADEELDDNEGLRSVAEAAAKAKAEAAALEAEQDEAEEGWWADVAAATQRARVQCAAQKPRRLPLGPCAGLPVGRAERR